MGEQQIWLIAMAMLPVIVLIKVGDFLTDDKNLQLIYSVVFGGIGGLMGYGGHYMTKNKSFFIKLLTVIGLFILSVLILYFCTTLVR